ATVKQTKRPVWTWGPTPRRLISSPPTAATSAGLGPGARKYHALSIERQSDVPREARACLPRHAPGRSPGGLISGTRSETEHAELLLADLVGRVDRLCLAEIGDRISAAAQHFIGDAAVVVGLDIGRVELDRCRVIGNRVVAAALDDVGLAARVERVE